MATTAVEPVFVDTNSLIYAHQTLSPFHALATAKLQALATAGHPLFISRQILREFLAVMSRPGALTAPVSMSTLLADVRLIQAQFSMAEDGSAATANLLNLLAVIPCAGRQIHDANIVATMLAHGIPNLLTHNVADFQRFAAYVTVVPLVP
jgi:predicted nucleic acid-binding protein